MATEVSEAYLKSAPPEEIAQRLNISLEAATELWRAANGFREDEIAITERKPEPMTK